MKSIPRFKSHVVREDNGSPRVPLLRPAGPRINLPPKLDRVHSENEQPQVISKTAVDGAGNGPERFADPGVRVVELPKRRDPTLKLSLAVNMAVAPNNGAGGLQKITVQGNAVLYADSTNGTDRLQMKYALTDGDQTQPNRAMVPGRLRREARFNFVYLTWTVTAGATATLEFYDDPDGTLDIEG